MLKACVNGARRPGEHPRLPVSPAGLARDVAAAGADAVHLHVKDHAGADTLDGPRTAEVLAAVRQASPGVPVGVTTGAWAQPDPGRRVAAVHSWAGQGSLPDFASVNWHENGADDVAGALLEELPGAGSVDWTAGSVPTPRWAEVPSVGPTVGAGAFRDRRRR